MTLLRDVTAQGTPKINNVVLFWLHSIDLTGKDSDTVAKFVLE